MQVLLFYIEQRPGNFSAPAALLSAGIVRGLSLLLPPYAPLPAAEPLRLCVLLCAAGSLEVRKWMLAVPGVAQALTGPAFCVGGCAEAHGALWALLTTSGDAAAAPAGVPPGGASKPQQQSGQPQQAGGRQRASAEEMLRAGASGEVNADAVSWPCLQNAGV